MRCVVALTSSLIVVGVFAVSPEAQNRPAAPVTNAPGIPGWAYPVAHD